MYLINDLPVPRRGFGKNVSEKKSSRIPLFFSEKKILDAHFYFLQKAVIKTTLCIFCMYQTPKKTHPSHLTQHRFSI